MNNKNKRKVLARVCAIIGIFAILASLCLVSVGAWEMTDIPFLNYFDVSAIPEVSRGTRTDLASITSVDPNHGAITMEAYYTGASSPYVPTSYLDRTLISLCPMLKVGSTYVLSGEASFVDNEGKAVTAVKEMPVLILKSSGEPDIRWYWGESLTITEQMLNANVMLYAGTPNAEEWESGMEGSYFSFVRMWINKDVAYEFCSYNIAYDLNEKAYYDGYEEGYGEFISDNLFLNEKNVTVAPIYQDLVNNGEWYISEAYNDYIYPHNGILYSYDNVLDKYKESPSRNLFWIGQKITITPISYGDYYIAGNCSISVYADVSYVFIEVYTEDRPYDPYSYSLTMYDEKYVFDWAEMGVPIGSKVTKIDIINRFCSVEYGSASERIEALENLDFRLIFVDEASYGYELGLKDGFNDGYDEGYDVGYDEGEDYGYREGYGDGNDAGWLDGYATGLDNGYYEGYDRGRYEGHNVGFAEGKETGFYEGVASADGQLSFSKMISAVVDVPVRAFHSLLNFEVLGVQMDAFALSLLTVALVVTVLKKVL